jgi:UDP-N-acetylglucosamine 2-epimerase (non-hydrolysing)
MTTILHVVGARPNFVKMAPVIGALSGLPGVEGVVAHTGQHYDRSMSEEILSDLEFPEPDHFLAVGPGSHGEQTAAALAACERLMVELAPDLTIVAGDVNSTLAAALAAAKLGIPVAHVESGLRSFDWTMPEEINRVLTDRLSDLLLTHSPEAETNLLNEGIEPSRIHPVGNTMIDSLRRFEHKARERETWRGMGLRDAGYVLVTLHRPSNVDMPDRLRGIVTALCDLAADVPVVFPIHPRTRKRLEHSGDVQRLLSAGVLCGEPLGYLDFLSLEQAAGAIVTDSGGIQEEAAVLGVRCFTLRANTERPVTVSVGANTLLGEDPAALAEVHIPDHRPPPCAIPLWDGHAADRSAAVVLEFLASRKARIAA